MILLVDREASVIDSYRPQTDNVSPHVTQADNPNDDLQSTHAHSLPNLPDPTVGGVTGSRDRNGFSTGFRSLFSRQQPFSGAVAKPPAIVNAVQGEVGMNNRAGKLYSGVLNQLIDYTPSQASYAAQWVGKLPVTKSAKDTVDNA